MGLSVSRRVTASLCRFVLLMRLTCCLSAKFSLAQIGYRRKRLTPRILLESRTRTGIYCTAHRPAPIPCAPSQTLPPQPPSGQHLPDPHAGPSAACGTAARHLGRPYPSLRMPSGLASSWRRGRPRRHLLPPTSFPAVNRKGKGTSRGAA